MWRPHLKGILLVFVLDIKIDEPLKPTFAIQGKVYKVEYKVLHLICFKCGRIGHHRKESCNEEGASNMVTKPLIREAPQELQSRTNRIESDPIV